jgi:hypothetical protein
MILQLNPPLPMDTPKGLADAHLVVDYGSEGHVLFVTFVRHSGECWTWQAKDVQLEKNVTGGIRSCVECDNWRLKYEALASRPAHRPLPPFTAGDMVYLDGDMNVEYQVVNVEPGDTYKISVPGRAGSPVTVTRDRLMSSLPF